MGPDQESARWRARISCAGRTGAGVVLDDRHVLTCAHVIDDRIEVAAPGDAAIEITLTSLPGMPTARARVDPGLWAPITGTGGGDIAVLTLIDPLPGAAPAPLHRSGLDLGQQVRTFGFPPGAEPGYWAAAELAGSTGPGGVWVQLAGTRAGAISRGFSGAAVIDSANRVVGICVARPGGSKLPDAYMIPAESMPGVLPALEGWIQGPKAVDDGFLAGLDPDRRAQDSDALARRFARWLARARAGDIDVIVTGSGDSAAAVALGTSVALADRERFGSVSSILRRLPGDAVPAVGSIDLAADATGRTAAQVLERIRDRIGLDLAAAEQQPIRRNRPRTVILGGIDAAADPAGLLQQVLVPLVDQAHRWQLRLLLAFRAETEEHAAIVRLAGEHSRLLRELERDVAELGRAEAGAAELHDHLSARIAGLPEVPRAATWHRSALRVLHGNAADPDWIRARLPQCREALERDSEALESVRRQLERARSHRAELRGRLHVYDELRRGTADPGLDTVYARAWQELWEKQCDLGVAEELVQEFVAGVLRDRHGTAR